MAVTGNLARCAILLALFDFFLYGKFNYCISFLCERFLVVAETIRLSRDGEIMIFGSYLTSNLLLEYFNGFFEFEAFFETKMALKHSNKFSDKSHACP
jgi:hypothetical protein